MSPEQIAGLAPDAASLSAGQKLSSASHWSGTGVSPAAMWGACQGSALYQVKIDLGAFAYNCSCPSRKLPCKHVLGLLLLHSKQPLPTAEEPEWVTAWLAKRSDSAKKKAEAPAEKKPVDAVAQAKRAEKRHDKVAAGIELLDLWMADLVRNGLAGVELKPGTFWTDQSRRLIDAQAKGLANRVRDLAEIPSSGSDWPERLLDQLGRTTLLTQAFRRLEQLPVSLQADVRSSIGWTLTTEELAATGEKVIDRWLVLGQTVEEEDRLKVQRSWLVGLKSQRPALILQFSAGGQPFAELIAPAAIVEGELTYFPSAVPLRASLTRRDADVATMNERPPAGSILALMDRHASMLAAMPWHERTAGVIAGGVLVPGLPRWLVQDSTHSLPVVGTWWPTLAVTGGVPVDLAVVWDGRAATPIGYFHEGQYRPA